MQSFRHTLHIHQTITQLLRSNFSRLLTLGALHSLLYKTGQIYVLYICPRVLCKRAQEVNIGMSS